ncbi:unnamed protein product [Adineta steineri]|uniref:Uncharacterized protein n=1 Tax=Adineta steineri TaxID=433720 RepID=A0A814BQX5_9BILA|nr:unnamed protein product [Adineta steineri]
MTCEHFGCSSNKFSMCKNHCRKYVCLEHLIEHGDIFIHDFSNLIDHLDKSTSNLTEEANNATEQIIERRQHELDRINRMYDEEEEEIRKRLTFAEGANNLLNDKQNQLTISRQQDECHVEQHDLEQLKFYAIEIKKSLVKKEEKPITICKIEDNIRKTYVCPLTRPNVFGIKSEHNIRLDCDGSTYMKYYLTKHFEYYHRMLPTCAIRLRDAIINDQLSEETKLFSDNEIIINQEYHFDCPLTDSKNIFGARSTISTLMHIPCTKKQLTFPSMINHLRLYHKMKSDVARKIVEALKNKSLHSDLILFNKNQHLGTGSKKK